MEECGLSAIVSGEHIQGPCGEWYVEHCMAWCLCFLKYETESYKFYSALVTMSKPSQRKRNRIKRGYRLRLALLLMKGFADRLQTMHDC